MAMAEIGATANGGSNRQALSDDDVAGLPTAMIFVPCADGVSHNESESITREQAEIGASVLLASVIRAAARSGPR